MQASTVPSSRSRDIEALVAEFGASWAELGRFFTSHRMRGPASGGAIVELTPAQIQALGALSTGGLRMSELAARLEVAESTVTRMVDRLERAGFVQRTASEPDRRCVVAELTEAGRTVEGELETSRRRLLREILSTLGGEDRRELVRLFAKVTAALRDREPRGVGL
jgi:DNA-binding MarR family transcriptional regulator